MSPDTPAPGAFASVRETHVGVVFLVGGLAYKLKKPIRTAFLDFTTRQRRLDVCRREVELNRRLAPDVYLGVADVTGPNGLPCEHLVVMRRMPESRRLATLLAESGTVPTEPIRQLARMLASFHAGAHRSAEITVEGGRDAVRARWTNNFQELQRFSGTVLDAASLAQLQSWALQFLDGREPLFAARQRAGRIVDGHGDLLTGDIFCLDDGPRVLDCLEFDDRLRYLDGLDDAAFLAMDLEYRGSTDPATQFLDWYAEFAADPAPPALRHHYIAYRALVRAKVACLRGEQGDALTREQATDEARRYAEIAARHLRAARVRLVLVGGSPGTGKSTVSDAVAGTLGMVLLSSDRLRKELHGLAPHDPSGRAAYDEGMYAPAATERTYTELLARAASCLAQGESVVLDASWTRAAHRTAAADLAGHAHAELVELRCVAPPEVVLARLRERTGSVSDADETIGCALAADANPWPHATSVPTGGPVDEALQQALRALDEARTPVSPPPEVDHRVRCATADRPAPRWGAS